MDKVIDGRYRILHKLGEGGAGEVYLVEDGNLGRQEALKVLRPTLAIDPAFVVRFRREARAINRLQHPNIVGLHDCGRLPDGRLFLAMEYVEGTHLDELLRRVRRLPVPRAVRLLAQLAAAMAHAHAQGVVHRDLKPSNMMITAHRGRADVLKVLDFGLAKIIATDYQETVAATKRGDIVGTPAYLAPDPLRGLPPEPPQDVYAFGCIAYELLTGRPPFMGSTPEVIAAHLSQRPESPAARAPEQGIPPDLDALVLRCLEKKPAARPASGDELARLLAPIAARLAERSGGERRTRQGMRPLGSDFDDDETTAHGDASWPLAAELLAPEAVVSAPTEFLSAAHARELLHQALRGVGEALLDAGIHDSRLIVALAAVNESEADLARLARETAAIEARTLEVEQAAREREASLSFAIGELNFERAQAHGAARADLEHQIAELEARLHEASGKLDQELAGLADRSISLAVTRDETLAALEARYDALGRVADELLAGGAPDPALRSVVDRLQRARGAAR